MRLKTNHKNNPIRKYLHIPLGMSTHILSSSTSNFNEFKTYLGFHFYTSGNCKLTTNLKNEICGLLSISSKTLNTHIKNLIEKGFFGYNKLTGTLFINGLDKVRLLLCDNATDQEIRSLRSKYSFILKIEQLVNLKEYIFTAKEQYILNIQSSYKEKAEFNSFLSKNNFVKDYLISSSSRRNMYKKVFRNELLKLKRESLKDIPNQFNFKITDSVNHYLGISNSFISNEFKRTKSWGCKQKKKAENINLLKTNKMYKHIITFENDFNIKKYISTNFPEKYNRFIIKKLNNKYYVFETLFDEISTNLPLTKRKKI
jgi:hypothetical protein